MRDEQTKKAGASTAAVDAAATAQLLSYQEPPSTTPNVVLQWRSIGTNKNISGFAVSSELFAFLGTDTSTKTRMLHTIAGFAATSSSAVAPPVMLSSVCPPPSPWPPSHNQHPSP